MEAPAQRCVRQLVQLDMPQPRACPRCLGAASDVKGWRGAGVAGIGWRRQSEQRERRPNTSLEIWGAVLSHPLALPRLPPNAAHNQQGWCGTRGLRVGCALDHFAPQRARRPPWPSSRGSQRRLRRCRTRRWCWPATTRTPTPLVVGARPPACASCSPRGRRRSPRHGAPRVGAEGGRAARRRGRDAEVGRRSLDSAARASPPPELPPHPYRSTDNLFQSLDQRSLTDEEQKIIEQRVRESACSEGRPALRRARPARPPTAHTRPRGDAGRPATQDVRGV